MNYCPKCGFATENMKFCPKCGFELVEPDDDCIAEDTLDVISEEDVESSVEKSIPTETPVMDEPSTESAPEPEDETRSLRAALIGKKPEHYVPIFEDLDKKGGQSWNWCGCLFSPMWFAYRKMYGWAAIAIAAPLVAGLFLGLLIATGPYYNSDALLNGGARAIGIACAIVFGILSNKVYKKRIDKLVLEIPADSLSREKYIKSKGGTSVIGVVVALVVSLAIQFGSALLSMGN